MESNHKKCEGGLRTQGHFKQPLPDKPLVSVITVVFNREQCLEQTIQSVISQSYPNLEYIIIDGGSTDGTLTIIQKYDHVIDYWVSESDQGIYDAMNKSLQLSTGDYVYFLGSDDTIANNNVINSVADVIKRKATDKELAMFYGDIFNVSLNTFKKQAKSTLYFSYLNICHQAIFYNRKLLLLHGGFDIKYTISADHVVNLKLWRFGAVYMPIEICKYAGSGISSINFDQAFLEDRNFMILSNLGILPFLFQLIIKPIHLTLRKIFPKNLYSYGLRFLFKR
ncbi:MAG: glycosyltransferase family 2 protein [Dolichospermum sp.]